MIFPRSHLPELAFVRCRFPAKLLHGPWTKDKVEFLRFLLWTTSMTVDWELVLQGRTEAIMQRRLDVIELFNNNRRLGKAPTLAHVRFAVVEGGCDRSIVFDTLKAAYRWGYHKPGWNWESEALDQWCEEAIKAENPKGKWLQLKLKELRRGSYLVLHPKTGDYDDVEGDKLVTWSDKWNQV
jgi:hypothetical protein